MFKQLEEQGMKIEQAPQMFHRLVEPNEVAALVAFLLGDESKFITKATYQVDGGFRG
jgi:NAD(P)-dependent dehydrogenase (short-subunit alcohol dehydrogenase family)